MVCLYGTMNRNFDTSNLSTIEIFPQYGLRALAKTSHWGKGKRELVDDTLTSISYPNGHEKCQNKV